MHLINYKMPKPKMKFFKTLFVLSTLLLATSCSDDDNNKVDPETIAPKEATFSATLPVRTTEIDDAHLQGNWKENDQIKIMVAYKQGFKHETFTFSDDTIFTGKIDGNVAIYNKLAAFYPQDAITTTSSDTLTQAINLNTQDGTLANLAKYDYCWALADSLKITDQTATAQFKLTPVTSVAEFHFNDEAGQPIQNITKINVNPIQGSFFTKCFIDLRDGDLYNQEGGAYEIINKEGFNSPAYLNFFPCKAQLHFTITTKEGKVYEATTEEILKLEMSKFIKNAPLTCTQLEPAKVGDYYYSDATWSTEKDPSKVCTGIVFALTDINGKIDNKLTSSPFGKVVALKDVSNKKSFWTPESYSIPGVFADSCAFNKEAIASLPYYKGEKDSFFSEEEKQQAKGIEIDPTNGTILSWENSAALSDFNGRKNSDAILAQRYKLSAAQLCSEYKNNAGDWYLPAAGELALLWTLQQTAVICKETHPAFEDFRPFGYWSSTESKAEKAWYINFLSGNLSANTKSSMYFLRAITNF